MENEKELTPDERNLLEAVKHSDAKAVQQALQNGANVNCVCRGARNNDDTTPLMKACRREFDEIVRILLAAGADTRWRNSRHGRSAILEACAKNCLSTVEILINHDKSLLEIENNSGWTPLAVAIQRQHAGIVRFLLDRGANVYRKRPSKVGRTNLMRACQRGNLDIVRMLLAAEVDVKARDRDQQTAVHYAVENGYVDIVKVLLDHVPTTNIVDATTYEPDMTSLLFTACREGHLEIARLLLARGANAHATSQYGTTTLMTACGRNNLDIARLLLLTAGVDLDAREYRGRTALHCAAEDGRIEVFRLLILNHNANLFAVDQDGNTPFDLLCRHDWNPAPDVEQFLAICGNKMTREHGRLALHAIFGAAKYSLAPFNEFRPPLNPLRVCLPLGKLTPEQFRILLQHIGMDLLYHRDDSGRLPIHLACRNNAPVEVLALMLALDSTTLHVADHTGRMPIHECCRGGTVDHSSGCKPVEPAAGGGVGTLAARNREGPVPLNFLCESTHPLSRTVEYMIKAFPESVAAQTNSGDYPFMIAASDASTASLSVVYELVRVNPVVLIPK